MATQAVPRLKAIEVSPATLQYAKPRYQRPFYQRKFIPPQSVKDQLSQPWLWTVDPNMPKYPYAKDYKFDEANSGLYGGKTIRSGSKISDGRNEGKTMRKWYPNVRVERLESQLLNVRLTLPIVARVSRTIAKCGGLDQYLLGDQPARIKELGLLGWKLRWLIMQSNTYKEGIAELRAGMGLSAAAPADTFSAAWAESQLRKALVEKLTKKDPTAKWQLEPAKIQIESLPEEIEEVEPRAKYKLPPVPSGYGLPAPKSVRATQVDAVTYPVTAAAVQSYRTRRKRQPKSAIEMILETRAGKAPVRP